MNLSSVLKIKKLHPEAMAPKQALNGDCGLDLYVDESVRIGPGQFVDVPCGIAIALPPGYWGLVTGRSSTLRKHGLMVSQGVIDRGYTGPLFAGVFNMRNQTVQVERGQRLAQLIVLPNVLDQDWLDVDEVDNLPLTQRSGRGFGSTGL